MRCGLLILLLTLCFKAFAVSEEPAEAAGWVNPDGTPVPDADNVKSHKGFGGWVIVTPDADWEEKWNTPAGNTPHFNEASEVRYGETVTILIFVINPALDDDDNVDVICDIQVIRPDGSYSIDAPGTACMQGLLQGNPRSIRLSAPIIRFVGEAGDLPGRWSVKIDLNDRNRGVVIPLETGFELLR